MRCYACCQENCGYGPCSCDCHKGERPLMNSDLIVKLCTEHPKYAAIRKPHTPCETCWRSYIRLHP